MEHTTITKKKFNDIPELDRKIIEGVPWAQKMWTILEGGLNKTFLYWCQTVLNMGEKDEILNEWINVFTESFEENCCDLVCDMEYIHGKLVDKIEQLLQKVQQSCKTLQIQMPTCGNKQLTLCQEQYQLEKKIEEYEKLIEARVSELNELRKKQSLLCNSLGIEPRTLKDSPLPSAEEIEEFQKHIEWLESEKFNRSEKFISIKEEILEMVKELNMRPSSTFEKEVFSPDDSLFMTTSENMRKLEQLRRSLCKKLKDVKEEIGELRSKIDDLWNLLDVDLKEREAFRQKHTGNSIDVLEAFRLEVKRCEELKKANIKKFVIKIRDELEDIWDKCHCASTVKRDFGFFYSDCYNEDLLELHEVEKAKWKKFYDENKELLSLLEKHKYLWQKMIELEDNATGPGRYNNRGGQLLKEEKERNKLSKQIPHIEDNIKRLAKVYQQRCGQPFTTVGETVEDYIDNLHEERENNKKQKLSARKLYKEQTTLTPAKSAINLFPSTSQLRCATPLTTIKRKLATPLITDKKRAKVQSEPKPSKVKKVPHVPAIKVINATSTSKRLSVERRRRLQKIRRVSAQRSRREEESSPEYGEFRIGLSNKTDNSRSTVIPSEVLSTVTPTSTKYFNTQTTPTVTRLTPKSPGGTTPRNKSVRSDANKLTMAKSQLKLIF